MLLVDLDEETAKAAEAYGLIDWCGDAYELTPEGEMWFLNWCNSVAKRGGA